MKRNDTHRIHRRHRRHPSSTRLYDSSDAFNASNRSSFLFAILLFATSRSRSLSASQFVILLSDPFSFTAATFGLPVSRRSIQNASVGRSSVRKSAFAMRNVPTIGPRASIFTVPPVDASKTGTLSSRPPGGSARCIFWTRSSSSSRVCE